MGKHDADALAPVKSIKPARVVHLFDVPEGLAQETGTQSIGMVTLTADEELLTFKRAQSGDGASHAKLATELAKATIVEVNGKKLVAAEGDVDVFWRDADPRVRQLITTAYAELHAATEDDTKAFLKSRRVRAG